MAEQLEDGYTRIANDIIEALAKVDLTKRERRVIDVVLRETYGFNRKDCRLTLSYIAERTRLQRNHVCETVQRLERRNILLVDRSAAPFLYQFQKYSKRWLPPVPEGGNRVPEGGNAVTVPEGGNKVFPKGVTSRSPYREPCLQVHAKTPLKTPCKDTMIDSVRILADVLDEFGKSYTAADVTYLGRAVNEHPDYATRDEMMTCIAHFDGKGKQVKRWGATFFNWSGNAPKFSGGNNGNRGSASKVPGKAGKDTRTEGERAEDERIERTFGPLGSW
jgi:phage replication O-like protein O